MLNKKGTITGRKTLFYIIFGIVATITVMILINIITTGASEISRIPPGLEEYVIINRFLYSPECFAYKDSYTERSYPLIGWERFSDGNLRYCYNDDSKFVKGFELTLKVGNIEKKISTANWKGFLIKKITKDVFVLKDKEIYDGKLTISIQDEDRYEMEDLAGWFKVKEKDQNEDE